MKHLFGSILITFAAFVLNACAPAADATRSNLASSATGGRQAGESELAFLARRNAELEASLARTTAAYTAAFTNAQQAAATGTTPRVSPPGPAAPPRHAEAVGAPASRVRVEPAPAPVPSAEPSSFGPPPAPPIGAFQQPTRPEFRVVRTGVVGNMGVPDPSYVSGMSIGRSGVTFALINVPYDVAIYVDDRLVCPTSGSSDGGVTYDFPQIQMPNWRQICVSPYEPDQSRDVFVLMHGQAVRHRVRFVALGTTTADPVGEVIGTYRTTIVPAYSLTNVIAINGLPGEFFR